MPISTMAATAIAGHIGLLGDPLIGGAGQKAQHQEPHTVPPTAFRPRNRRQGIFDVPANAKMTARKERDEPTEEHHRATFAGQEVAGFNTPPTPHQLNRPETRRRP